MRHDWAGAFLSGLSFAESCMPSVNMVIFVPATDSIVLYFLVPYEFAAGNPFYRVYHSIPLGLTVQFDHARFFDHRGEYASKPAPFNRPANRRQWVKR